MPCTDAAADTQLPVSQGHGMHPHAHWVSQLKHAAEHRPLALLYHCAKRKQPQTWNTMIMKVGMVVTMRSSSSSAQKLGCSPDSSGAAKALQAQATSESQTQ